MRTIFEAILAAGAILSLLPLTVAAWIVVS
jgi:hypothetical protein